MAGAKGFLTFDQWFSHMEATEEAPAAEEEAPAAEATGTVFISHSFTLPMIDSKLGFIPLLPLFFIINSNFS